MVRFNRGDNMLRTEVKTKLKNTFSRYKFVMRTSELMAEKIYYADIQNLLEEGLIEKIRRGYYQWIEEFDGSEIKIINRLFPDAVLCMDTALFYYKYSDRNPTAWHISIDKNASRKRTKIDYPFIKAYRMESVLLTIGETIGEIDFLEVRIYDRDRTICDVLRNMNKMDKELFNKAIQNYVKDPRKNVPNLMLYAKRLKIQKRVRDLIGVWL